MSTKISWTTETWNPVHGCSKVSPGCAHCYAETLSLRYGFTKLPWLPQNAGENVQLHPDRLEKPLHWAKPRVVFVNSMSDLFHELVPEDFIWEVFAIMAATQRHTYQVLTKRPERMAAILSQPDTLDRLRAAFDRLPDGWDSGLLEWPLPNVWLGTSVENQHFADIRIPQLVSTPAAVHFLSCEPLLGPLDLQLSGRNYGRDFPGWSEKVDWVIVGGESGPGYRPMDVQWARKIRDQCIDAHVAFFFKQGNGIRSEMNPHMDGYIWHQFPGDLQPPVPVAA